LDPRQTTAWNEFVKAYMPIMYQLCRRKGLQEEDAKDVCSEVMEILIRKMPTFRYQPEKGHFRSWLGTVVSHEISRQRKRTKRPGRGSGGSDSDASLANLTADAQQLWHELYAERLYELAAENVRARCTPRQWLIFQSVHLQHQRPSQVAKELHTTAANVSTTKRKVLTKFQAELTRLAEVLPFSI
jgi:RNA polymerase sigma-70 factor (ECF subfamily)